ncbi:hypothetical protein F4803DRAFT_524957 [Xylaria telfairii]|nr:hypothetical protein F4803DRAFT_524957 [Xylaria telfairii]
MNIQYLFYQLISVYFNFIFFPPGRMCSIVKTQEYKTTKLPGLNITGDRGSTQPRYNWVVIASHQVMIVIHIPPSLTIPIRENCYWEIIRYPFVGVRPKILCPTPQVTALNGATGGSPLMIWFDQKLKTRPFIPLTKALLVARFHQLLRIFLGYSKEGGLEDLMISITASMNSVWGTKSQEKVTGSYIKSETVFEISWPWIILPMLLNIFSCIVLVSVIRTSVKASQGKLWKGSTLASLYHGITVHPGQRGYD